MLKPGDTIIITRWCPCMGTHYDASAYRIPTGGARRSAGCSVGTQAHAVTTRAAGVSWGAYRVRSDPAQEQQGNQANEKCVAGTRSPPS